MPDSDPMLDVIVERWRQESELASQVDLVWRILLIVGVGLVVALAVAAVILAARWFPDGRRSTPPPPTSIISAQPERHWRYTGKKRR